jgi:uncharacterized Tic20 family protein
MMTRPGTIATGPPVEFSQSRRLAQMANDVAPDRDRMARQWAMLLHLSTLAGFIAVGAGFIAPIVIWQIKKTDYPELDPHGKNVANWLISYVIYVVVCSILLAVFIGFFLLLILGALGIIFPIVGAIKANNGEVWKYPLSIAFIK